MLGRIFSVVTLVLASSCHPMKQAAALQQTELEALVETRLGKNAATSLNKDGSFMLCKTETKNPSNNMMSLNFLIIRVYDKRVVEEGSVTMAGVEWSGDFEVEVKQAAGQAQLERGQNSTTRTIDLRRYRNPR